MTAAPLRFHRPLSDIVFDMERSVSPCRYDRLLDEWVQHPEVVAMQVESDAIDALLESQESGVS